MTQQGASRLVVLAVLFAGFYIDDRYISVPGIASTKIRSNKNSRTHRSVEPWRAERLDYNLRA